MDAFDFHGMMSKNNNKYRRIKLKKIFTSKFWNIKRYCEFTKYTKIKKDVGEGCVFSPDPFQPVGHFERIKRIHD